MLAVLAFAAVALAPLPVMPSDTPPPFPLRAEAIDQIKSAADVIAASRLANGMPAPATLILPRLQNRAAVLRYMIEHYPAGLRGRADFEMPWAWMLVDRAGHVGDARILRTSGKAEFDSLALGSLRIARFDPALVDGSAVAVWVPMPVQIAYEDLAAKAPPEQPDFRPPEQRDAGPRLIPYTVKPNLVNRSDVSRALAQNYPPELRAAGIGGRTMVWTLLSERGDVIRSQVKESSGYVQLDRAALEVARIMKFTPARDGVEAVKVWIALPIVFQSR